MSKESKPKRGRKPQNAKAFDDSMMIRMFSSEREAWEKARVRAEKAAGVPISMSAYIRRAANFFCGKVVTP